MKTKTIRLLSTTCALASLLLSVSPVSAIHPDSTAIDFSQDEEKYSRLCTAISWNLEKNNTCNEYKKYLEDKINQSEDEISKKQSKLIQIDNSIDTVTTNYDNKLSTYEENISTLDALKESYEETQQKIEEKKEELSSSKIEQGRTVSSSIKTEKQLTAPHTTDSDHKEAKKSLDSLESKLNLEEKTINTQENIVQIKKENVEIANSLVKNAEETYSTLNNEIKSEIDSTYTDKQTLQKMENVTKKQKTAIFSTIHIATVPIEQPASRNKTQEDLLTMKKIVT